MKKIIPISAAALLLFFISQITLAQNSRSENKFIGKECGTMKYLEIQKQQDPGLETRMQAIEAHSQQFVKRSTISTTAAGIVKIPVVVHVVYNTAAENVSDVQIQSQITVLNEDFRRTNADAVNTPSAFSSLAADVEIEFCLATIGPDGNPTTGITRTNTTVTSFSYTSDNIKYNSTGGHDIWDRDNYLNMWVCDVPGYLGYAKFPGGNAASDGVVINYEAFGTIGSLLANFDKGRTATHEVGHWLNLRHIWGDASCGDDLVSDTPTQETSNSGCHSFPHVTCNNGINGDMFMNYMDYSHDVCMNMFSLGQKSRMQALFTVGGARVSLLSSNGCGGNPPSPSYCASNVINTQYEWIANVQLNTINNSTTGSVGYADYTNISTSLTKGSGYTITLSPGFVASAYMEYFKVWIDYNNDKDFGDAGENVYTSSGSTSTVSGTFTIPSAAATATTRMRVSMSDGAILGPCASFTYGEVEDYSINLTMPPSCGTPSGLSATNITSGSTTLNWTAVSGALTYSIRYKPVASTTWSVTTSSTSPKAVTALTPSTQYEFQVRSLCGAMGGGISNYSSSSIFTTAAPPCGIPSGLSSIPNSAGNASAVSWIAVSGATSYNIRYKPTASSNWTNLTSTTNSKIISGLTAATAYEFQVQTVCSAGVTSNYSSSASFTTGGTPSCGIPSGLSATSITSNSAILKWTAVTGAPLYKARYKPTASTTWATVTSNAAPTISGLTASTPYEFQVQALCSAGGTSNYSASSLFTTASSCPIPIGLSATNITSSSTTLNWTVVSGAISYNVLYKPAASASWSVISSTTISKTIASLTASTPYEFQVQTVCSGGGTSNYSASSLFTTTAPPCSTPSGISATNITSGSATLNWGAVSGVSLYNVRYKPTASTNWTHFTTNVLPVGIGGLTASTPYEFQVQAVCSGGGTSNYSASSVFTTTAVVPCGMTGGLSATNITSNSAILNWTAVSGAGSYNVRYRPTASTTWTSITIFNTPVQLNGLTAYTLYEVQVQTICSAGGTSNYSASTTFTTAAPCPIPTGLSATNISSNSATLNWTAVSGASSYGVRYKPAASTTWENFNSANSPTVSALIASTTYEFQVRTVCSGGGISNYSASYIFTTTATTCQTPNGLSVTNIASGSATLNWAAVSGATSYRILYRKTTSTLWSTVGSSTNVKAIGPLSPSTQYEFKVQTVCSGGGTSNYSSPSTFTTGGASKVAFGTDSATVEAEVSTILLYPNPASSVLNVDYKITADNSFVLIHIYDMKGELLITTQYNNMAQGTHTYTLDLNSEASISSMANGVFLCMVNINGRIETKRFMRMK